MMLASLALVLAAALQIPTDAYDPYPASGTDPLAECLLAEGFRGDPTDGIERIYAPREWIEWCAARTDDTDYVGPDEASGLYWAMGPEVNA